MMTNLLLLSISFSLIQLNMTLSEIKDKTGKHEVQLLLTEALKKQHSESEEENV